MGSDLIQQVLFSPKLSQADFHFVLTCDRYPKECSTFSRIRVRQEGFGELTCQKFNKEYYPFYSAFGQAGSNQEICVGTDVFGTNQNIIFKMIEKEGIRFKEFCNSIYLLLSRPKNTTTTKLIRLFFINF